MCTHTQPKSSWVGGLTMQNAPTWELWCNAKDKIYSACLMPLKFQVCWNVQSVYSALFLGNKRAPNSISSSCVPLSSPGCYAPHDFFALTSHSPGSFCHGITSLASRTIKTKESGIRPLTNLHPPSSQAVRLSPTESRGACSSAIVPQ